MTQAERRRWRQTWAVGLLLTAVVAAVSAAGGMAGLERAWYDARVRWFQFFPGGAEGGRDGDGVVVVHIDDAAIEEVGRWPWPRVRMAQVVRELDEAGAAVVALDLLFDTVEQPRFEVEADGSPGERIDGDAALAEALAAAERALLPVDLRISGEGGDEHADAERAIRQLLRGDLTVRMEAARQALADDPAVAALSAEAYQAAFLQARQQVMRQAVHEAMEAGAADWEAAFERILPGEEAAVDGVLRRLLQQQWRQAEAERALWRFGRPVSEAEAARLPQVRQMTAPIALFGEAADASGFVNWGGEGVLRTLPLWIEHEGRAYPQFGLAAAMAMLGVDVEQVELEPGRVVLPGGDGRAERVIATHARPMDGRRTAHHMVVPWWGPAERWQVMFDRPDYQQTAGQLSLVEVWEVVEAERRLRENEREADRAIESVLAMLDPARAEAWREQAEAADAAERRRAVMAELLEDEGVAEMMAYIAELRDEGEELDDAELGVLEWYEQLGRIQRANARLTEVRDARRQSLRERVEGRPVLVGWTATGAAADFVATPLHTRCPGVVVHAAVTQSVLDGRSWSMAPPWWGWLAMVLVGLAVTGAVGWLSPVWATLAAMAIGGGWAMVDGLLVFDFGGVVMAGATPMVTAALVWGGCVGWRYLVERTERTRITRRFSSYVDPALVSYVIDHPEQGQLRGEVRELTVVFTDLAGFTSLSERLGGRSVELLNQYMGLMVPLIREHGGFVNKFLGDGIMFFYGAPVAREDHAASAVATVLAMQRAMERFNADLAKRGLGPVGMRAGVATGSMIVGDAGPPDASDYTVLGDTVNLAARLESANKATGTAALITAATADMLGERYAVRPIGRLQVVGKREGVAVYEPMGEAAALDRPTRAVIEQSREMVEAYQAGRFDACLAAAEALERDAASAKLVGLYRRACRAEMERGERDDFAGQIVLTEK